MFDDLDLGGRDLSNEQAFDLMQELESNTPEQIRRQRTSFRMAVKAEVTLQSGNASQLLDFKFKGVTGDVSEQGCGALFPIPARVGDIYRLEFDRMKLGIPLTYARCVRCGLVREGAFDCGFKFFSAISLPEVVASAKES